jgi:hypothetical protein
MGLATFRLYAISAVACALSLGEMRSIVLAQDCPEYTPAGKGIQCPCSSYFRSDCYRPGDCNQPTASLCI